MIGRSDLDLTMPESFAVDGPIGRQRARPTKNLGQPARRPGGHVKHDQERRRDVGGQAPYQARQRLHATGRRTDDHEVASGRGGLHLEAAT
jgi:hypothetical protein